MLNEPPVGRESAHRRPLWRRLPWREGAFFLVVLAGVQLWQARGMASGVMPALAGTLADGRPASLATTLAAADGRPVLVYVWAAWCPVCRLQEDTLASVSRDWPMLTLAMQSGNVAEVAAFMTERRLAYPALVDERGELAAALGVRAVPAWFVVDGGGNIRFSGAGYSSGWGLRARLWWAGANP